MAETNPAPELNTDQPSAVIDGEDITEVSADEGYLKSYDYDNPERNN